MQADEARSESTTAQRQLAKSVDALSVQEVADESRASEQQLLRHVYELRCAYPKPIGAYTPHSAAAQRL